MLLKLQRYQLCISYTPGRDMYVADTLSRAFLPLQPSKSEEDMNDDIEVMTVSMLNNMPEAVSLEKIREGSGTDKTMIKLKEAILHGWPNHKQQADEAIRRYWDIRGSLYVADGLVCQENRIIIPEALKGEILSLLHESHQGINKTKSRANQIVHWPGIGRDIEEMVEKCSTCLKHRNNNAKEPLMPHPMPSHPWEKVGSDIMTFKGKDYLVVVDYYSKFPEISFLNDKTAGTVISKLKTMFARHGIPQTLMSDNMPYGSREFSRFAKEWGIKLCTSSPLFPQSNGQSERYVQTLKRMLKKANEEGRDINIALLEYRNTPLTGMDLSPAQMLMGRHLRTKLPTMQKMFIPNDNTRSKLVDRQESQKRCHDKHGVRQLPEMAEGDVVRVKKGSVWEPAVVIEEHSPRSYIIDRNGQQYRRNRSQLIHTKEEPPESINTEEGDYDTLQHDETPSPPLVQERQVQEPRTSSPAASQVQPPPAGLRRSSRARYRPAALRDYVQ